ncbi:hypothetical protein HYW75_00055 [Candidatus Pacearchaeota archaeon]|nr:hypothetical protein [Candidatus Pacearchaeota archaeon]
MTRNQFVAECQRVYKNNVVYYKENNLFSEKHLPVDFVCRENLPHPSILVPQDIHPTKVDLAPIKSLDTL